MGTSESDRSSRVLLFGLGAIGGFYAYIIGKNKNVSLSVIARSNYDAVKQDGLKIDSDVHGKCDVNIDHVYKSIPDITNTAFDFIVCAHKAIKPATIPPLFKPITNDQTTFVIIQNGVGNEEPFRAIYPSNTIISCVAWTGAVQKTPGIITHSTNESLLIGIFPNPSLDSKLEQTRLQTFADLLKQGGTNITIESDIQIARWEKVVWNVAWNPLTALTGLPVQTWLETSAEARTFTKQLMEDVIAVGRKLDVPLKDGLADELIARVMAMKPLIYSSMYQDAQSGRPLEMDVIVGFPMRKANEFGMEVSALRAIFALTNAVNARLTSGSEG
ncbi:hypothetical protein CBER1_10029 [Cercospora berteroae]|uniref:2-dehydropantoate 2-reductase n=1 Tax=Cercospora berteroae TaxID=357750 RepID=A0A2S6BXF4_9PEZI|nr:hypothetical protein CBER1_10029 [Cercospora berteroae]